MFSWAALVLVRADIGTLNSRLQTVQTPTAGVVLSHLTTRRIRLGMRHSVPHLDRCQEGPDERILERASDWKNHERGPGT